MTSRDRALLEKMQKRDRRRQRLSLEQLEARRLMVADTLDLQQPFSPLMPHGSRGYETSQAVNLAAQGEVDTFRVDLSAGRPLSIRAIPVSSSLQSSIELIAPDNSVVASATAGAANQSVILNDIPILANGTYRILVTSISGSGDAELSVFHATTLESEVVAGSNDTLATAQNLGGAPQSITNGAISYLVSGRANSNTDWYRFPVQAGQSIDINMSGVYDQFELFDTTGQILALNEVDRISGYVASSTGELAVRIEGSGQTDSNYVLMVTIQGVVAVSQMNRAELATALNQNGVGLGRLIEGATSSIRVAVHGDLSDVYDAAIINQLNNDTYYDFSAQRVTTSQIDTLEELLAYDVVVLGTPYEIIDAAAASALLQYFQLGNGVVAAGWFSFAYQNVSPTSAIGQPLDQILPVAMGSAQVTTSVAILPTAAVHPVTEGITSFSAGGSYSSFATFDTDAVVLAASGSFTQVAVAERFGRSVYLAPSYFWTFSDLASGMGDRLLEQAVAWAANTRRTDSFEFSVQSGQTVNVAAVPRQAGNPTPVNNAEIQVDLLWLDGATPTIPVATVAPSAPGTAPAVLSYTHAGTSIGRFAAQVRAIHGSGDYDVVVQGHTNQASADALTVLQTTFPGSDPVNAIFSTVTIEFDEPLLLSSVQPGDLLIASVPSTSVTVVDARTLQFTLGDFDSGDGSYTATLSNMQALDGSSLATFNTTFTIDRVAPTISSSTVTSTIDGGLANVDVDITVSESLLGSSVIEEAFSITALDLEGTNVIFEPSQVVYTDATRTIRVSFEALPQSRYVFTAIPEDSTALVDHADNLLDGAGNGTPGSIFILPIDIDIDPVLGTPEVLAPRGVGVSLMKATSIAGNSTDVDTLTLDLQAGAALAIKLTPAEAMQRYQVELLSPGGTVIATQSAGEAGGELIMRNPAIASSGVHSLRVTSLGGLGRYDVRVYFNTALELENAGANGVNDTTATAEIPDMTSRTLRGIATTTAVAGTIGRTTKLTDPINVGFSSPLVEVPRAIAQNPAGGGFLLTTGTRIFSLTTAGALQLLSTTGLSISAMVADGTDVLASTGSSVVFIVNPSTGQTSGNVALSRSGGGTITTVWSMTRGTDGTIYVLFSGSGISSRAVGQLNRSTGLISSIVELDRNYDEITVDSSGNLLAIVQPNGLQGGQLFDLGNGQSGQIPEPIYVWGDIAYSVVIIDPVSGDLFRASDSLTVTGSWQRQTVNRSLDGADVYAISLSSGQWLSLAASSSQLGLELISPTGQTLATGTPFDDVLAIEGFIAPSAGTYWARLSRSGPAMEYRLIVSRDANLRLPGGLEGSGLQPIPPSGIVYGELASGATGGAVTHPQSVTLPRSLRDSGNYLWDISSQGSIVDGSSDAYDVGMELSTFNGSSSGFSDATGRSIQIGPSTVSGLSTRRYVYVPTADTFARFIDSFTNPTSSTINATITYATNLGSDSSTVVIATSSGDTNVSPADSWTLTDDTLPASGDPAVGHLFYGPNALQPNAVSLSGDGVFWRYQISVPAAQTVSLMSFAVQNFDRTVAGQAVRRVYELGQGTLDKMPVGIANTIANWRVSSGASFELTTTGATSLTLETSTPDDAAGLPLNAADPRVALFELDGASPEVEIVRDENSAGDGKNARISYSVTDTAHHRYGFNVDGFPDGDFVLQVGSTPAAVTGGYDFNAAFPQLNGVTSLLVFPNTLTVQLDADVNVSTVAASDLRVNGSPATSVQVVNGRTLVFSIQGLSSGDGVYNFSMSNGSLVSLQGTPLTSKTQAVTIDASSPVVIGSNVVQGDVVSPGTLVYQVTFNERLATDGLGPEDFILTSQGGVSIAANTFAYDSEASVATLTYNGLVETSYTLRIRSSATAVRDLLGNLLDGNPSFPLPSGDGTPGDDFIVGFTVDTTTQTLPIPTSAIQPSGGRIYQTQVDALVGAVGDRDRFVIDLREGQAFFASVRSLDSLVPRIQVLDTAGNILATRDGEAGNSIATPMFIAASNGSYTVVVESANSGTGSYRVAVVLGAASELESSGGANNDTIATAEDLQFLSIVPTNSRPSPATRAAVYGLGGTQDYFRFNATAGRPVSLSASILSATGSLPAGGLALLNTDGTILAVGTDRVDGVVQDILEFVPVSNMTLVVRLDARSNSSYGLVVVNGGAFDIEPNDNGPSAQLLQSSRELIGGIGVGGSSFSVDFSDPVGGLSLDQFTATGLWHVTAQAGGNLTGHSAPNMAYFGIDSSMNFNAGVVSGTLTSPPLSLRAGTSPRLRMNYRLQSETGTTYDRAEVQVSTNGGASFTTVATKATHFTQSLVWRATEIDLSSFAGQTVLLRFSFNSGDSVANDGLGWQIDDLEVEGVADLVDFFQMPFNEGDVLVLRTVAFQGSGGQPPGDLIPQIELFDPNGILVGAGAGEVTYTVPASGAGNYRSRIFGSGGGDYRLEWDGSTANSDTSARLHASIPADGQSLAAAPVRLQMTFDQGIRLDTLSASDLIFADSTILVTGTEVVDGSTVAFQLNVPASLQGQIAYSINGASILDWQGTPIQNVAGSFIIDRVGPLVIDTAPANQASAPFTTLSFLFSEPVERTTVDLADIIAFRSPSGTDLRSQITNVAVDGSRVLITFTQQVQAGAYTFTIGGNIADLVGNRIDQDQDGVTGEAEDVFTRIIQLQSPDLTSTIHSVTGPLVFGQSVSIDYTVRNVGDDPANERWSDRIYLSRDNVFDRDDIILLTTPATTTLGPLDAAGGANDNYRRTANVTLPLTTDLSGGNFFLLVQADGSVTQPETNDVNNIAASSVLAITLPALPDLAIESISIPATALSGQQIPVRWRLVNRGTGDFTGTAVDTLRLSNDVNFGSDQFLGNFSFTGTIPAGGGVNREQLITLPIDAEGPRYVLFTADATGNVFEHQGESNNNATSTLMNVTLAPLPNLRVTAVTPPTGAFSGQNSTVQFVVTNTGTGATSSPVWYEGIYLSIDGILDSGDTLLGTQVNPGFLEPGASYSSSHTFTLPRGIAGDYQLIVVTDVDNRVFEHQFENDNSRASSVFPVTLTPPPDLQVQSVIGPFSAFSGQPASVTWTVANRGPGRTQEPAWYDTVYMSADNVLSNDDVNLGSRYHNGILNPNETYSATQSFDLPVGIAGNYFFIVVTDSSNFVYENVFESNNVGPSAATTNVRLTPPPDLVAAFGTLPSLLEAGRDLTVPYEVTNQGITPTVEHNWRDRLYLSTDAVWDTNDLVLQTRDHYGNLVVFRSYSDSFDVRLPWDLTPGNYFLIVRSDADNRVFELDNDNNVVVSNTTVPLTISPPDLTITQASATTVGVAGQPLSVTWSVQNIGIGSTNTQRADQIILSSDQVLGNGDDIVVGQSDSNTVVAPGVTQSRSLSNVNIPLTVTSGQYHLYVKVDSSNQQFESNEGNNRFGPLSINITQTLPDVISEAITFEPSSLTSGGNLAIRWTTRNQGAVTNVSYWTDAVFLSNDRTYDANDLFLGHLSHNVILAAGQTRLRDIGLPIPADVSGSFYVIVASDSGNSVLEGPGESNNYTSSADAVSISLAPVPDLTVTTVNAPTDGFSGQSIDISWIVRNDGPVNTTGAWYDAFYLSADQVFDRDSDIYLGYRNAPRALAAGQSYSQSARLNIPLGVAGPLYLFVATDSGNQVNERSNELNNVQYNPVPVTITLLPPADLVVGTINIPPNSEVGSNVTIGYTVENRGVNPARGQWSDSLFLSSDGTYSVDDIPLGVVDHNGDVPGGGEYSETLSARLPGVLPGNYKIIVRSDIRNAIVESNEANNLRASLDVFAIDLPTLTLGTAANGSLDQGETRFWKVNLTAGDSVRFRVDNANSDSTTEIYVRRGAMPSRSIFDFAANTPFINDPSLVIPVEQTGTYFVMLYGSATVAPPTFSVVAESVPLSIFDVKTNQIGNTGPATIKVSGARFAANAQFSLVNPTDSTQILHAANVLVTDSVTAYVTFNASDIPKGVYNLSVQTTSGTSTLPNSVTVGETIEGDVLVTIDGAARVRPDRFNPFRLQYVNDGNTDFSSPLLIVENPNNIEIGFSSDEIGNLPVHVYGFSADGTSDILRPGEIGSIPMLFRSSDTGIMNLPIRPVRATDSAVVTDAEWLQIEASIRPANLTSAQWAAFWSSIKPRIGQSWGSYVQFLQDLHDRTRTLDVRKGDVRSMMGAIYEDDPNWRPSSVVVGRLLNANDASPRAGINMSAYRIEGDQRVFGGTTVTQTDGSFTFFSLTPGQYEVGIGIDDVYFDMNRNLEIDSIPATFTLTTADLSGLNLYVAPIPVEQAQESQPTLAVDGNGVAHLVWSQNEQLWHAIGDGTGGWHSAQEIVGAVGSEPRLIAGETLVEGSRGLMVVYRTGNANTSELYYVLGKLNASRTAYLWSDPVAMTSDMIHDGQFDAAVGSHGRPVVLAQRVDAGTETTVSTDDTDIYSWSETPNASFETALLAAAQAAIEEDLNELSGELSPQFGSVTLRMQNIGLGPVTIPNFVPIIGGTYKLDVRGSATVSSRGCSAGGRLTGELVAKVGKYLEFNGRGSGGVNFSAEGTRGNCEYVFDNAIASVSGGGAGKIPASLFFPGLGALPVDFGGRLEAQVTGNFTWDKSAPFPSLPKLGNGTFRGSAGLYGKGNVTIPFLGSGELEARLLANFVFDITGPVSLSYNRWGVTALVRFQYEFLGYKRFKEFSYTWNPGGDNPTNLGMHGSVIDTTQIQSLGATAPQNFSFGIEPADAGSSNDYGTSTFSAISNNLQHETAPKLATAPDGTLYGLWSNTSGVQVHRYNAAADTWSLVGTVGDDAGLATQAATLAFTPAGQGIIVFTGQDLSGLNLSSTPAAIEASFNSGADLFYATFNPSNGTFSNDQPLFAMTGNDGDIAMVTLPSGEVMAIWTHQGANDATIYAARWNSSTSTWGATEVVGTSEGVGGSPSIKVIGGVPTVIWSEISGIQSATTFNTNAPQRLRMSRFVDNTWTESDFTYSALVSTMRQAVSTNGDQVQIFRQATGDLMAIGRSSSNQSWSTPMQLGAGTDSIQNASVTFDRSGQAVAIWTTHESADASSGASGRVLYAVGNPVSGVWSAPQTLASAKSISEVRFVHSQQGKLIVVWTGGNADNTQGLYTAEWSESTRSFQQASQQAMGIESGSVAVGSIGSETVMFWRQYGSSGHSTGDVVYSVFGIEGWGQIASAAGLIHSEVRRRSSDVSRVQAAAQAAQTYGLAFSRLLSTYLGGTSQLITGAGVYLEVNGILPFSPPEDCCKCDKFEERTQGRDEGCGSSTEVDMEKCIRITTYKPCVERPRDPNDILGPEGFGAERWVTAAESLPYRIRFENAADASAAAQVVEVTQRLDEDLALQSFGITGFGFRGYNYTVPNAPPFYSTVIDLTAELGVLVEFTAGIDVSTREAFWRLVALDPATGQPPLNPDLGLLIPNDANGNGEGFLDYRINARANVTTGARIDAQARIVFDTEEPIDTPPIFNTVDEGGPTSNVVVGTAPTEAQFPVSWIGQDESNGSGIASYTILVSIDDGDYGVWLEDSTATQAVYNGTLGTIYKFVSLASDNAGNLEAIPDVPDWTVVLPGGSATIGDFIWDDTNNNGLQDQGELGKEGVTVKLFLDNGTANGQEISTSVTNSGGLFSFTNVPTNASYFLAITSPAGYAVGKALQGNDQTIDSNFGLDGRTAVFSVINGNNLNYDGALVQLGSIGGAAWEDSNSDGLRQGSEQALMGWTIYLDLNDNGTLDNGEPSDVTDAQGAYEFTELRPGTYVVAEVMQAGWVQTFPGEAGANATGRSYVRNGQQASLQLPSLQEQSSNGSASSLLGSGATTAAADWIGLDDFINDGRYAAMNAGTVVVIDTGIDVDHPFFGPDLDGDGVADRIIYQYDFADNDADASDVSGHGSHVTSLIAGADSLYPGVAQNAEIIALKVFGDNGRGTFSNVERALTWVIQHASQYAIDAINLSIGDGLNWSDTILGYGISDELAVLADMGIIAVAASGNGYGIFNSPGLAYPAADPNTVAVGAVWDSNRGGPWMFGANGTDYTTAAGRITSFSQRDVDTLDTLAPGAVLMGANQYGGVTAMRGTSMAAPQVTGAALWAQQLARQSIGRNLTTSEFRYLLRQSGNRLVDGDDEQDNVTNTGGTFSGLNLMALSHAVANYDGSYTGDGFLSVGGSTGTGGNTGTAANRPNRYVIDLAPGQQRVTVDFGNRLADGQAPDVLDFSPVVPTVRPAGIDQIDITFSEPLLASSFQTSDFVLTRGTNSVSLATATLTSVNATTWRLSGLSSITSNEGAYSLSLQGSQIQDLAGNTGIGEAIVAFSVDRTAPVGTVRPLASNQTTASFQITVDGQDPISQGVQSGVTSYEVYVQVNGGNWELWSTLPANTTTATYTAQSNQVLGFYALAIDAVGNREPVSTIREAVTRTGDLVAPTTVVTAVDTAASNLQVQFSGQDMGGSGLVEFELWVSIDDGAPVAAGRYATIASSGVVTGHLSYPAVRDGNSHSYRFFTIGRDAAGNSESAPSATDDVTVMVAFEPPVAPEVNDFRVQNGALGRSYIRNLLVGFSQSSIASAIANSLTDGSTANDRIQLRRFENDGTGSGVDLPLAGKTSANGTQIQIEFGEQGIGGDRNSIQGNGYYVMSIDVDGNLANGMESNLTFYRLLGDTNGDRTVNGVDVRNVNDAQGVRGLSPADVNGDAIVNVIDRAVVNRGVDASIPLELPITDPASLGTRRVMQFDVQRGDAQRSFVRYLDTQLSHVRAVEEIMASLANTQTSDDRIRLEQFDLQGQGTPTQIDLTDRVSAVDRALSIDFGSGGLPQGGSSNLADGYYRLSLDLDGDAANGLETHLHFYRLLGDINGDRIVNELDQAAVNAAAAFVRGSQQADVNGDGLVNVIDRLIVARARNRSLSNTLPLDD